MLTNNGYLCMMELLEIIKTYIHSLCSSGCSKLSTMKNLMYVKDLGRVKDNKVILMMSLVITLVKSCEETSNLFPSSLCYSTSTTVLCHLFIWVEVHFP